MISMRNFKILSFLIFLIVFASCSQNVDRPRHKESGVWKIENASYFLADTNGNYSLKESYDNAGNVMLYDNYQGDILQSFNDMIIYADTLSSSSLSLKTSSCFWFMDDPMRLTTWTSDGAGGQNFTIYTVKKINRNKQMWYFTSGNFREEYTMVR